SGRLGRSAWWAGCGSTPTFRSPTLRTSCHGKRQQSCLCRFESDGPDCFHHLTSTDRALPLLVAMGHSQHEGRPDLTVGMIPLSVKEFRNPVRHHDCFTVRGFFSSPLT